MVFFRTTSFYHLVLYHHCNSYNWCHLYHLGTYQVDNQYRHLDCYRIFRDRCEETKDKKIKRQIRMKEQNRLNISISIQFTKKSKKTQVCLIFYLTICHIQLHLLLLLFHLTCIGDIALHLDHCCCVLFPTDILNTHSQKFQHHIVDF